MKKKERTMRVETSRSDFMVNWRAENGSYRHLEMQINFTNIH